METIPARLWRGARWLLRSRLFSLTVLLSLSLGLVTYISVTTHAFTVITGETKQARVSTAAPVPTAAPSEDGAERAAQADAAALRLEQEQAMTVQVTADGVTTFVKLRGAGTVADVLDIAGVALGQNDVASLAADEPVSDGLAVKVARVDLNEYSKTESIPFETETKYTNTLPKGQTLVTQAGQRGQVTRVYRDRVVDGALAETLLVSETVTQPVKQIKLVGTVTGSALSKAPFDIPLDSGGQPLNFKQLHTGSATAYSGEEGIDGQRTSTGRKAQVGIVAVDPKKIPYGSKLYIVSPDGSYVYGYAIAGDTGGAALSGKIIADLYMDTIVECNRFGRRTMNVYILE